MCVCARALVCVEGRGWCGLNWWKCLIHYINMVMAAYKIHRTKLIMETLFKVMVLISIMISFLLMHSVFLLVGRESRIKSKWKPYLKRKKPSCSPKREKKQKLWARRAIQRNVLNSMKFKIAHKYEYIIHLFLSWHFCSWHYHCLLC